MFLCKFRDYLPINKVFYISFHSLINIPQRKKKVFIKKN